MLPQRTIEVYTQVDRGLLMIGGNSQDFLSLAPLTSVGEDLDTGHTPNSTGHSAMGFIPGVSESSLCHKSNVMKQRLIKVALFNLKLAGILIVLLLPGLLVVSVKAEKFYSQLWKDLGISKQAHKPNVSYRFVFGFLYEGGFSTVKNIITGNKAAIAEDLLEYTKSYVQSEQFVQDYAEYRLAAKPGTFHMAPTELAVRKKYIDAVSFQIRHIERKMKTTEGPIRKLYQEQVDLLKRQIEDFQDPYSKTVAYIMENEHKQFAAAMDYYSEQIKLWEAEYPVDAKKFLKQKLSSFLRDTKDVDYDAKTYKVNGRKYFEETAYNFKPDSWKYAHFAGKEVTGVVRKFVEQWLTEI